MEIIPNLPAKPRDPIALRQATWWQLEHSYYEVFHALAHFARQNPYDPVETCDSLFKGLNLLWTCRRRIIAGAVGQSDSKAIQELLLEVAKIGGPEAVLFPPPSRRWHPLPRLS